MKFAAVSARQDWQELTLRSWPIQVQEKDLCNGCTTTPRLSGNLRQPDTQRTHASLPPTKCASSLIVWASLDFTVNLFQIVVNIKKTHNNE